MHPLRCPVRATFVHSYGPRRPRIALGHARMPQDRLDRSSANFVTQQAALLLSPWTPDGPRSRHRARSALEVATLPLELFHQNAMASAQTRDHLGRVETGVELALGPCDQAVPRVDVRVILPA